MSEDGAVQGSHFGANVRSGASPSISVIVPFYNRSKFLPSVIETLRWQTFKDFELIIVDDGSTDGLANVVESLQLSFSLRLIRLGRNMGAALARNAGIKEARGRYVALLDSDDRWHPEKLGIQFKQLETAPDRSELVSLTRQRVTGNCFYVAPRRLMTRGDSVGQYLFQFGGIIQSSMMFMAADLAKSVLFVEEGRGHDDWSFALRLEQLGARFEMLPEALTIYNDERDRHRLSPPYSAARFDWLEKWRRQLRETPYLAARAAFVSNMRHDRSMKTLGVIGSAFVHGAIPAWRAAYYATTWAFPWVRTYGIAVKATWLRLNGMTEENKLSLGPIENDVMRNK